MINSAVERHTIESTFPIMGNTAHVIVVGDSVSHGELLATTAHARLAQIEARWSRFIASSEVSQLNSSPGIWQPISIDTAKLLQHLLEAYRETNGLFNPFLLPALIHVGYSHSMSDPTQDAVSVSQGSTWTATDTDVEMRDSARGWEARLVNGATIDPGGLGKGLAADIVAEELFALGATGVLVNVGGDLRCIGTPSDSDVWSIQIEATETELSTIATVLIPSGGVATSTTFAKRWRKDGITRHHVLNPADGQPLSAGSSTSLRASTVIASSAVWAEVFATALLVGGAVRGMEMTEKNGLAARGEYVDGSNVTSTLWSLFESTKTDFS